MKQTTLDGLSAIFSKPNALFDITKILDLAAMVLSFIRQCRSPESAKAQIQQGGPVAYAYARRIVRDKTNLRGKAARAKAKELTVAGTQLTEPELDEMIEDAQDAPVILTSGGGIFQLGLIGLLALTFAATAPVPLLAQEKGIFQIDVEQNRRLDEHDAALARLDTIIANLKSVKIMGPAPATAQSAVRAVSPAAGVQAIANNPRQAPWVESATGRTSDDHLIRAHGYTPQQIAGLTQLQKDRLHGHAHEHPRQTALARAPVRAPVVTVARMQVSRAGSGCPGGVCPRPMFVRRRWR